MFRCGIEFTNHERKVSIYGKICPQEWQVFVNNRQEYMKKTYIILLLLMLIFPRWDVFSKPQTQWFWTFEHDGAYELPHQWIFPKGKWQISLDNQTPGSKKILQLVKSNEKINDISLGIAVPDFEAVEISALIILESEEGIAGIIWGYVNIHTYYSAVVNKKDLNFKLSESSLGEVKTLAKSSLCKTEKECVLTNPIQIKIEHAHQMVLGFINDTKVFEVSAPCKKGQVGVIGLGSSVRFDNILAKHIKF